MSSAVYHERAPMHPREAERLQALYEYGILDSERESAFDAIVDLLAEICECPIAVVSLVDRDRQWFKAETGLGARSTPVESSICAHALLNETQLLEIEDTQADNRTATNPLCLGNESMRFYAGMPLVDRAGFPLGSLCVLDYKPRVLTDLQRRSLKVLADQVMRQIELRAMITKSDLLRREVDHRIKNSLQTVMSMVKLQANRTEDPIVSRALDDVLGRVSTVAALHQELHSVGNQERVEIDTFVNNLLRMLADTVDDRIHFDTSVEPATLSPAQANSVGVIVNEFVANTAKHGLGDLERCTIGISGRWDGETYHFVLSDNGNATEEVPARVQSSSGLGMRLINSMAGTLSKAVNWSHAAPGLKFDMQFQPAGKHE